MNGLKLVLRRKTLQSFLEAYKPKVLCLNETKLVPADLKAVKKQLSKYFNHMHFVCASNRRNYGGVAILYNLDDEAVAMNAPLAKVENKEEEDEEEPDTDQEADGDDSVIRGLSNCE